MDTNQIHILMGLVYIHLAVPMILLAWWYHTSVEPRYFVSVNG